MRIEDPRPHTKSYARRSLRCMTLRLLRAALIVVVVLYRYRSLNQCRSRISYSSTSAMSDRKSIENTEAVEVRDKLWEVRFSAAYWRELGQRLKPCPDLDAIEANNSTVEERLEKVIDHWKHHGDNPCWVTLAEAVAQCLHGGREMKKALLISVGLEPPQEPVMPGSEKDGSPPYGDHEARREYGHQGSIDSAFSSDGVQSTTSPLSPPHEQSLPLNYVILSNMDAKGVYEEIKEAKKCTYLFAYKLLPIITIQEVRSKNLKSEARLIEMLEEYLKLFKPKPSWEGIAGALKSDFVKLPQVAAKIEAKFCPGERVVQEFENLGREFFDLIIVTRKATEDKGISVGGLVDVVIDSVCGAQDNEYLMDYSDHLRGSTRVDSVFDRLRCHWDYLNPEIYGEIIRKLSLPNLDHKFDAYQRELARFLNQTLVTEFCNIPGINKEAINKHPADCAEFRSKHLWKAKHLKDVENLRKEFALKCNLQKCAVTITSVKPGCVDVTMLVPESTDLKVASDLEFIREHSIIRMEFKGMVVYSQDASEQGSSVDPVHRVRKSRFQVALRYILKAVFATPVRKVQNYWKTPLTVAVEKGDLQEVLQLIASGEDPNPNTISTPLKEACSSKHLEIAEALLRAGADPNHNTDDWTPLMEASRVGDSDMIQLLMEYGADPNTVNDHNWTSLMAASNNDRSEAVDALLQHGADPNKQDHVGWSALLAAVHKGSEDIALRLVETGANPHFQNLECLSAMRLAITNVQERLVYTFLDRHPDVKPGLRGHPELDWTDKYDETDLLFACKMNHLGFVKGILRKGANPNLANINGESPLFAAIGHGNSEMVEDLLRTGADPNMATIGAPPLFAAVQCGESKVVAELLHTGANPNVERDEGTPLVIAVRCGEKKMVEYLLEAGADPNMASYVEQLPLHHARRLDDERIVKLLEHYNAKPEREQELPRKISARYYSRIAAGTISIFVKGLH